MNLVEEAVVLQHGDAVWDRILVDADLDGVWTSLGNYPDDALPRLVGAGSELLGVAEADLCVELGRHATQGLSQRYPGHFAAHDDVRSFLLTLDDLVHAEVVRLHPDAQPPRFWFDDGEDGSLLVHYRSHRSLCALAEGMIEGAGVVYDEPTAVHHEACQLHDAPHCSLRVTFETG
ncbi:heme NO-binding domain-containing protein [Nocardioides scoriae]|uniref:heme NO-binding domain-containing protein n=1 Tax=Nocardioides scoriae TaxID=642780 RepID=UPI0012FAA4BF|nr:heme NO-binding domain-containing protein [Nocardioides scoriae]